MYGQQFALLYYDIKTPAIETLGALRDLTRSKLPIDMNVLYSTSDIPGAGSDQFKDLAAGMRFTEGMAIDSENDVGAVARYFTGLGVTNCWYGDGISALAPSIFTAIESSVRNAAKARDLFQEVKKVYVWTLEDSDSIKDYLDMGVDAILIETKHLGNYNSAALQSTVTQVRNRSDMVLATRSDYAFCRWAGADQGNAPSGTIEDRWPGWIPNYTPVDAGIMWPGGRAYFFKGDQYFIYDADNSAPLNYSRPFTAGAWAGWPPQFYPIDAALFWPPTGKAFFFKGDQYIRYNLTEYAGVEGVDEGPDPIKGNWPGLVEALGLTADSGLDSAVYWPNGYAYFIKGNHCVKYASGVKPGEAEGVVAGPVDIVSAVKSSLAQFGVDFPSLTVDAAVYWPNGLVYVLCGAYSIGIRPARDLF